MFSGTFSIWAFPTTTTSLELFISKSPTVCVIPNQMANSQSSFDLMLQQPLVASGSGLITPRFITTLFFSLFQDKVSHGYSPYFPLQASPFQSSSNWECAQCSTLHLLSSLLIPSGSQSDLELYISSIYWEPINLSLALLFCVSLNTTS